MNKRIRISSLLKLNRLNRLTIKRQLYLIYMAVIVVPIVLIGAFLLFYTYHLMVNYYTDMLKSDNHRVRNILFEFTTEVYNISKDIAFTNDVRRILTGEFDTRQDYMRAVDQNVTLDQYVRAYGEISEINIYTDNPALTDYKQFKRVDEEIAETVWYQKAVSQSNVFWQEIPWEYGYRNSYWNLCLVRKIPLFDSSYNAVLVIHISNDFLRMRVDSDGYLSLLAVDEGPVFYSSDRERYGNALPVFVDYGEPYFQYTGLAEVDGDKCFANVSTFHAYQSDSRVYICTLDGQGYDNIRSILYMCGMVILSALVIPAIMIHFFTNYFTGRVGLLRQEMHKASNQDYELIPTFQGNDELSEAFSDLQVMVFNIKEQEAKVYKAQIKEQELLIRQQEMEFKMLASQINPHFLYNTLETIRMKALKAGDKEVSTAIKLLGKAMRYVLENTGTSFTTLEEELNHVDEYMKIQQLRFGSRIQFGKQIEEGIDLSQYRMLPLILQPVVENAIQHGMDEVDEGGRIVLSVYRREVEGGQVLFIDVDDNGSGMTEEALGKLRNDIEIRDMSRSKSIGLYNINQRMKLYYGDGYRVHIYSELGAGTRVRLMIPTEMRGK